MDCVGVTGKIKLCTAPSLFGISEVPASIPQEEIEGQLITDIEDRIKYEMNKPRDWQINAHLVDIFEEENSYDTHDVNYVMLPDGDTVFSGSGYLYYVICIGNTPSDISSDFGKP